MTASQPGCLPPPSLPGPVSSSDALASSNTPRGAAALLPPLSRPGPVHTILCLWQSPWNCVWTPSSSSMLQAVIFPEDSTDPALRSPGPLLTAPPFPFTRASVWTVSLKVPCWDESQQPLLPPWPLPSQSSAPAPLCPSPSSVPTVPSSLHAPFPPRGSPVPDCEFSFPCHFQLPCSLPLVPPQINSVP